MCQGRAGGSPDSVNDGCWEGPWSKISLWLILLPMCLESHCPMMLSWGPTSKCQPFSDDGFSFWDEGTFVLMDVETGLHFLSPK
jgi:hypothetical protein